MGSLVLAMPAFCHSDGSFLTHGTHGWSSPRPVRLMILASKPPDLPASLPTLYLSYLLTSLPTLPIQTSTHLAIHLSTCPPPPTHLPTCPPPFATLPLGLHSTALVLHESWIALCGMAMSDKVGMVTSSRRGFEGSRLERESL